MTTNDPSVVHVGPCAVAPTNCYVWDESRVRTISGYDQIEDWVKYNLGTKLFLDIIANPQKLTN